MVIKNPHVGDVIKNNRALAVDYFNQCLKADSKMMKYLLESRAFINNTSDENPIVMNVIGDLNLASPLGLVNGMLIHMGLQKIYMVVDETNNKIIKFE